MLERYIKKTIKMTVAASVVTYVSKRVYSWAKK